MIPEYAEWATYQWAVKNRHQHRIAEQLGVSVSAVCVAIRQFLADARPDLLTTSEHRWGAGILSAQAERRKEVARSLLVVMYERAQHARVFDPDETSASRDVWLTFVPGHGRSLSR